MKDIVYDAAEYLLNKGFMRTPLDAFKASPFPLENLRHTLENLRHTSERQEPDIIKKSSDSASLWLRGLGRIIILICLRRCIYRAERCSWQDIVCWLDCRQSDLTPRKKS
jgi:hypothetical protein